MAHTFPYELTIGMIVKDEIKFLETCLQTLQPLRDAIPCQLIITDTGSTDGTREIAEKYADILIDFPWIQDFSAARNTGVEQSQGRWFAFVDADNDFDESILQIAQFLQSKESHKLDHAVWTIRHYNYTDNRDIFFESPQVFMFNFENGKRFFQQPIHETIKVEGDRKILSTLVHHWGYTQEMMEGKTARNSPLINKMIADEPNNLRHRLQWILETQNSGLRLEHCDTSIAIAETSPDLDVLRLQCIYVLAALSACDLCYWSKFEELLNKIQTLQGKYPDKFNNSLPQLEYLGVALKGYHKMEEWDKACEIFQKYKKLYLRLKKSPDVYNSGLCAFQFCQEREFYSSEIRGIDAHFKAGSTNEGKTFLRDSRCYRYREPVQGNLFLASYISLCRQGKEFSTLGQVYHDLQECSVEKDILLFQNTVEQFLESHTPEEKKEILQSLAKNIIDPYTALSSLRLQQFQGYSPQITKMVTEHPECYRNPAFASLIEGYLRHGSDPLGYLDKFVFSRFWEEVPRLFKQNPDFGDLVEAGYQNPNLTINSLIEEKIWAYLGLETVLYWSKEEDFSPPRLKELFQKSVGMMHHYITQLYNPALLGEIGRNILPEEEMFALYAQQSLEESNAVEAMKILKKGLDLCPRYAPVVKFFGETLKNSSEVQTEMNKLATQMKMMIRNLIASGNKVNAQAFLQQLQGISPNDPEIADLLAQCK